MKLQNWFKGFSFLFLTILYFLSNCNYENKQHSENEFDLPSVLENIIPSTNLPLIIIDSKGRITDSLGLDTLKINQQAKDHLKAIKVKARIGIVNNDNGQPNLLTGVCEFYNKIFIKLRGNTSLAFNQKSYTFSLRNSKTKASILGLPQANTWVLYGPYSDKSLIRNALIYHLFEKMGHYAPRTRFCEAIIDGKYQGIYLLTEKIERDPDKINISPLTMSDSLSNQITGGYIIKIDRDRKEYWKSPYPFANNTPAVYDIVYPLPKHILCEQQEYIKNYVTLFEMELHYLRFIENESKYLDMIDVNSFIDFLIINEFSKNYDAYRLSTYMYKDVADAKLTMGPVWDYDYSLGAPIADYDCKPEGWMYKNSKYVPFWWERMMIDTAFSKKHLGRWKILRENVLSEENIYSCIDSLTRVLKEAKARHFERWPIENKWPNKIVEPTYEENIDYLKYWIKDRLIWLDNNWGKDEKEVEEMIVIKAKEIKSNSKWLEYIANQSESHQISIEDQIMLDAIWLVKKEKQK
jgi:hypothetical protein